MKKILLGGSINPANKGDQARVKATIKTLTQTDGAVSLALLSNNSTGDRRVYAEDNIEIVESPWSQSHARLAQRAVLAVAILTVYSFVHIARKALGLRLKCKLLDYDAFVIVSGIDFSDFAGRWPLYYSFLLVAFFGIILGKPVMCYSQSMGPIENHLIRQMTRFFLNRMKIISVREENSLAFLRELDVNKPKIRLTADAAFLLEPNLERMTGITLRYGISYLSHPRIGLSASPSPFAGPGTGYCSVGLSFKLHKDNAAKLSARYLERMAKISDWLVKEFGATLVFLPNCNAKNDDDRRSLKAIQERMSNKDRVVRIDQDITLADNMEIMGCLDFFVGTRLHANILAAIMGVPLVPLVGSGGPRIPGVMKTLGLGDYVCNVMNDDEYSILKTINEVWYRRHAIKREMQSRLTEARARALDNIALIQEL